MEKQGNPPVAGDGGEKDQKIWSRRDHKYSEELTETPETQKRAKPHKPKFIEGKKTIGNEKIGARRAITRCLCLHTNSHTRVTSTRRSRFEQRRGAPHCRRLGWKLQAWTERDWRERQGQEGEREMLSKLTEKRKRRISYSICTENIQNPYYQGYVPYKCISKDKDDIESNQGHTIQGLFFFRGAENNL